MFEKLIEKILQNYFGIFFSELDRKTLKLSVWYQFISLLFVYTDLFHVKRAVYSCNTP